MTQEVEKRWNDCWHDEKRKLFVTKNSYFEDLPKVREREHQLQYEKETSDNGIVFKEDKVKFFFGIPALKLEYDNETSVNFLLPTLTDDMITKEIVKNRLTPQSNEETIMYQTVSEPWLEFGDGLKLTEKEYELGMDLGRYSPIPLSALKIAANRK
ncbi:MAG: hypothetical protein IS860_10760 [Nitrosopumilus sp.]|nr:hypothetical protein [Nitrosopumilus sp.]